MVNDNMKKVLILKNIDSKYIDQAIIFLRSENKGRNFNKVDHNFIVDEAVNIVNQYVERNYFADKKERQEKNKKIGKMLNISIFLAIILLISLLMRAFLF